MEHPAAKVLVELADLQDQEVGDGTTSVVSVWGGGGGGGVVLINIATSDDAHTQSQFCY